MGIFLVALSFVIGAFFIKILQGYDIHEKEPFIKMAAAALVGGALSFLISEILYTPVYALGMKNLNGHFWRQPIFTRLCFTEYTMRCSSVDLVRS